MKKIFILSALLLCTACVSYSEEISCKDFNKAIKKHSIPRFTDDRSRRFKGRFG